MSGALGGRPGPVRLSVRKQELKRSSKGSYQQLKAYANAIQGRAQVLVQQATELDSLVHLVPDLESRVQESSFEIFICC